MLRLFPMLIAHILVSIIFPGALSFTVPFDDRIRLSAITASPNSNMDRIVGVAVNAATVAVTTVNKAVSTKTLTVAALDESFVAVDTNASQTGVVDSDGLPLVYNKELIETYWAKEAGALKARWGEFLGYSVPFLTRVAALLIKGGNSELSLNGASLARDARIIMEALGPTYVKLGQVLSVRPDILPQAALNELQILQDSVAPFSTLEAVQVIEAELGGPVASFFSEISDEPVAAASLAQVYRAKLAFGPNAGTDVAVKVQRPGILKVVSKDLYVLRRAAEIYQGLIDRFAPKQRTNYVALLNEWAVGFYTELDFLNELRNQRLMKGMFCEQGVKGVYVPDVMEYASTRRLLVSEWVEGKKLSHCDPSEIKNLVTIGQECFLVQLLQMGVFHADPHPGNLLRLNESMRQKGEIGLLDFGLVARLKQDDMDKIVGALIHMANRDYPSLVEDFILLGILPSNCDRSLVVPLMDKALTPYIKGGGAKKYEKEVRRIYGMDKRSVGSTAGGFQAMTADLLTVLNDVPFSIPPYFALIGRAVVTLEGMALTGNPDYGIITEAYPFVARKLLREDRPEIQKVLAEILYGSSGGGGGGEISLRRLLSLVNGALGAVAKSSGASIVDLDGLPFDGALSPAEVVRFLLGGRPQGLGSGGGGGRGREEATVDPVASLWALLEPELLRGIDLVWRQATRRAADATFARLPRLRVPLLGTAVGPPLQDMPALFVIPALGTARAVTSAMANFEGSENRQHGTTSLSSSRRFSLRSFKVFTPPRPRVKLLSAAEIIEATCPALTRSEELYALSLIDLGVSFFGPRIESILRGEVLWDGFSDVNFLRDLIVRSAGSRGGAAGAISSLLTLFPGGASDSDEGLGGAKAMIDYWRTNLSDVERANAVAITRRLAMGLAEKLEARLGAI